MTLVAMRTDTGQELHPPDNLNGWSCAIGIGVGALCLFQGLRRRPPNLMLAMLTVALSVVTAAACSLMTSVVLLRIREAVVFRGDHLVTYESDLRIWSASVHHGKGPPSYGVMLRDYPGMFDVPERDYLSAFGPVEHAQPAGYCVTVTVQRAGTAVRILAQDGMSLPEGSLRRCPARVG